MAAVREMLSVVRGRLSNLETQLAIAEMQQFLDDLTVAVLDNEIGLVRRKVDALVLASRAGRSTP